MANTNATRTKCAGPEAAPEAAGPRHELIDQVADAFSAMRERAMRGLRNLRRDATSVAHIQVLARLQAAGPLPVGRLARSMGMSPASATGMLGRMEERGLVERLRDASDRRVVLVRPAAGGRAVLEEIGSQGRASLARVLSRLEDRELVELRNGLQALERATRELAAEDARADAVRRRAASDPANDRPRGGSGGRVRARAGTSPEMPDAPEDPE